MEAPAAFRPTESKMRESLFKPSLREAKVLAASAEKVHWRGFPTLAIRSPEILSDHARYFSTYWLSVVIRGQCDSVVRYGSKRREFHFEPGMFYALPIGQHWDTLTAQGSVDTINFPLEETVVNEYGLEALFTPCSRDVGVGSLANALLSELIADEPGTRLKIEELCVALGSCLARLASELRGRKSFFPRPVLSLRKQRVIKEYLEEHLDQDLGVSTLAREVGLSPSQFAVSFRNAFGRSVHKLVLDVRLAKAQHLLEHSDLTLAQVSQVAGFSSQSHLTTACGRAFGMTPQEVRKQVCVGGPAVPARSKESPR